MSKEIDYAHPTTEDQWNDGQRCGITIRDYFAAAAIHTAWADLARTESDNCETVVDGKILTPNEDVYTHATYVSALAYQIADAMIAARKEGA